ncbi:hypothetical protein CCMA1212_000362 [Trichoderma ghanense]|uniref:Zn(2)-C6 fungal-type domain-containing protein n=1 Tax=Trichoderma ghanense TaxID=65468 RepID=A0ABY2HIC9_9HYPO
MTAQEVRVDTGVQAQGTTMTQTREMGTQMHSACSECRRRKQKCSRYWPCRHCGTRRVANDCTFQSVLEIKSPEERQARLGELAAEMEGASFFSQAFNEELDDSSASTVDDLEALGYSSAHIVSSCSLEPEEQRV